MNGAFNSHNTVSPSDQLYAELLEEITARVEANESVDVEAYIREYPQFSARIRAAVPALQALQSLGVSRVFQTCSTPFKRDSEGAAISDYCILREIGRGGMGVVYEAEQMSLGRRVALKILPFAALLNERQLERFATEATAAARLQHAHIVPIYTVGCERGIHFYAMQLIDGPSLAEVIAELRHERHAESSAAANEQPENRDTVVDRAATVLTRDADGRGHYRSVARIGREAAEALQYAHEHGVLHRDIKPSNLLVDAAGHVWIADFGLARVEDESQLTRTGDVLGTLCYMSPEQATGQRDKIDARSDVYSLGATLYELATLRPPYAAADPAQLLRKISASNLARPRRWNAVIPEALDRIVMRAMARTPSARYATARELADDLQRFLEHKKVCAPRAPRRWRGTAWLGRHRRTLACAVVLSAAAVVAFAFNRQPTDVSDHLATRASDTAGVRVTFLDVFVEDSEVVRPGTPREVQIGPDGGIYVANTSAGEVVRMDPDTAESNVFIPSGRGGLNTPHGLAWDPAGNVYVSSRDRDEVLRFSRSGAFDRVFVSAGRGRLNAPAGLAFGADANGDGIGELYVSSSETHSVMRFDGATGEPLPGPLGQAGAADLVPPGSGGLRQPQGMCIHEGHVYVASSGTARVLRYDMISGEFAGVAASRPGLESVEGVAVWDGHLYVNNHGLADGPMLRFDLATGESRIFVQRTGSGLQNALRPTFDPQGRLYVGSSTTNDVLRFDRSGRFDARFPRTRPGVPRAPRGLMLHDHSLFVCSSTNEVLRYDMVTGAFSGTFISAQSGLDLPVELVLGPDANDDSVADVYVSCFGDDSVRRFDGTSGLPIGDGLFVRPGAGGLNRPVGLAFRNQVLYVASWTTNQVLRFDSRTGDFLGAFVAAGAGGLRNPSSLVFGDDQHLYVSSDTAVMRYDALTGAPLPGPLGQSGTAEFVPAESGGLGAARGMAFKSGHLYVASGRNQVVRYDALTGRFDGFAADADTGLSRPVDLAFEPGAHGLLFVSNRADDKILRYRFVLQKHGTTGE